jgi:hypothetical protein
MGIFSCLDASVLSKSQQVSGRLFTPEQCLVIMGGCDMQVSSLTDNRGPDPRSKG